MKTPPSRKRRKKESWPRKIRFDDRSPHAAEVNVYRRKTGSGTWNFMVARYDQNPKFSTEANQQNGKREPRFVRRFDSYPTEADAIEAATRLSRQLSERDYLGASMTKAETLEYASATQTLKPLGVSLTAVAECVKECLKSIGGLSDLQAAARLYAIQHRRTTAKRVADVVAELLTVKESRGASLRYIGDLRSRLSRFAADCQRDACNVTTADVQTWLDGLKLEPQGYTNFRRVLNLLFEFAVARGYASANPVERVERVKVRGSDIEIFTPAEIARLLAVAPIDFLPCIAIGAFAGLRSAEIERLEWSDVHLAEKFIVVGASKAKTAGRRIVPIHDNLADWLRPYAEQSGKVWPGTHDEYYETQQETAAATAVAADPERNVKAQKAVTWKSNGLRHSYASYRFAGIGDAGRVAGELGNSAAVVHRHYRELVKPADALRWFAIKPETPANVTTLGSAARD